MSVFDETWDRPTCEGCGQTIAYGEKRRHQACRATKQPAPPTTKTCEKPLVEDIDASRWAKEFHDTMMQLVRRGGTIDLSTDLMHTWFANAIMAGHDHVARQNARNKQNQWVYVLTANQGAGDVVAVYSERPCKSQCDRDYALYLKQDLVCITGSDIPEAGQGSDWNCRLTRCKLDSTNRLQETVKIEYLDVRRK